MKKSEEKTRKEIHPKELMSRAGRWIRSHKKRTAVLAVLLIVFVVFASLAIKRMQMSERMGQETQVSTTVLKKQSLRKTIGVNGTIESETSRSIITNVSNAEISEVLVQTGDEVKAGDVLCILDSSKIEQNKELTEQNLSISLTKASMNTAAAQRNLEDALETRDIQSQRNEEKIAAAGESYDQAVAEDNAAYESYENALALAEQSKSKMADAQAQKESAQARKTEAENAYQTELSRLKADASAGAFFSDKVTNNITDPLPASPTDADAQMLRVDRAAVEAGLQSLEIIRGNYQSAADAIAQAESAYQSAQEMVQKYQADAAEAYEQHKQKENAVNTAASAYDQAVENKEDSDRSNQQNIEAKQDALKSAQLEQSTTGSNDKLSLETYVAEIKDCTVIAPFDGVITSVSVEAGDMYNGSEICVLQDNSNMQVSLSVDEYDIADISNGMKALIKTEATDDLEMSGIVSFVAPLPISAASGSSSGSTESSGVSYEVKITIDDPSDRLRLGMTAKTSIILEEAGDVFAVPYECVETSKDGSSYISVLEGEETRRIPVETGLENDYYIEVRSDELQEGMRIAVPDSGSGSSGSSEQMPGGMMGGMMGGGAPMGGGRGGR